MIFTSSVSELLLLVPVLVFAFTIHELCHGLMAYMLGDSTAKRDGRLSLNPIRHIDPLGMLLILLVGFGWAKPVMVNPHNLKNPKIDMALIAIAGPISNFIMAFISLLIWHPLFFSVMNTQSYVTQVLITFASINVMLGVFNLIPIPPLDGSKVLAGLLPDNLYYKFSHLGRYGMIILIIFMITGATSYIVIPITGAIFNLLLTTVMSIYGWLLF